MSEDRYQSALGAVQDEVLKVIARDDTPADVKHVLSVIESICRHGVDIRTAAEKQWRPAEPEEQEEVSSEDDEELKVKQLKPIFVELLEKQSEASSIEDGEKIFKEIYRHAFLAEEGTTEEDFERLWPKIRDKQLMESASYIYEQVISSILEDVDAGKL